MSQRSERPYTSPHEVTASWTATTDTRVVRVAVDAAGGDNAPQEVVAGALQAAGPTLRVILVGDEARLRPLVPAGHPHISVHHAPDVIGSGEEPAKAARNRTESSLVVGLRLLHEEGAEAFVSAGNTGAVVAGSLLYVRRIRGVHRPAICTIMPCMPSPIAFLDVGATAECRPEYLHQSALMGSAFAREVMGIAAPTVGLLSIGEEPTKGTPEVIEAHRLLAADARLSFFGNVEGRDIMNRTVDVVVTDGFTGNVALKTIEGTARALLKAIRASIDSTPLTKVGGLLLRGDLMLIREALDPEEFGGAILAGVKAPVIIAHGNSKARGISQAIRMGRRCVVSDLLPTILREVAGDLEDGRR